MEKSRHEKRKEARLEKNKKKHESWLQRQNSQKLKRTLLASKGNNVSKAEDSVTNIVAETESADPVTSPCTNMKEKSTTPEISESESKLKKKTGRVRKERENGVKRTQKTKFEEYLEMDNPKAMQSAEEDLEFERKLAKKLKVKQGKLRGDDDGMNMLMEGIFSEPGSLGMGLSVSKKRKKKSQEEKEEAEILDDLTASSESEEYISADDALEEVSPMEPSSEKKKKKKRKRLPEEIVEKNVGGDIDADEFEHAETCDSPTSLGEVPEERKMERIVKYVAPHLRSRAGDEPEEHTQIRRRVRGLINRMSESNVESITAELSTIYRSVTRGIASQIFCDELLASCSNGPRGSEQYAAIFAAFIAGMACLVGMDFSARLMASLAKLFEDEYQKEDNLSLRNITLLLSYLYIFGVCDSELIYDFLMTLGQRLTEVDVSVILSVLQCCGMKIRGDDPSAMKSFILSIQNRVNELKALSTDGQTKVNGKRMEFMLETICDIKNNKKRAKEDTLQHTRIKKWLQKLRVDEVLLRGLKWSKLIDPEKKGQWWLSGDLTVTSNNVEKFAQTLDKEVLEAQKMLQLAAAQRMNTDARKAIFCVIMSSEDYINAFEKLLRLDLPGKQDREIIRVLVECCLQEKVFNKYYTILASKLCEHDKNHKFTLQYCVWDQFKELETMSLQRSMHLAKFVAQLISSFSLSLVILKAVDLTDPSQLTPKRIMHFRMLFEAIFECPENLVWNMFTRIAINPDYEALRSGIKFFVKEYVINSNQKFNEKFKKAKEALNNAEGFLM